MKLSKKKLQELKNGKIQISDLNNRYFVNSENEIEIENILNLLNKNICSFQQIVDKLKEIADGNDSCSQIRLSDKTLFDELIKNNALTRSDLKCLVNGISSYFELTDLCMNTPLIKHILKEFILDIESVNKINSLAYVHNIFCTIGYLNRGDEEVLKLNELNKKMYMYSYELTEVLKDNEIARNRLNEILVNNLESTYDFDELMRYLKKPERRNLMNI